ncbi:hypothetical protein BDQ17DRAFT_140502 [Cyathus striatus]|nr:hypothetical protein BDQ17DRAFT_140502 [Cyathus striatus]
MKATLVSAALLFAAATAQSLFYIYTPVPDPSVCVPFIITWAGGTPPYVLVLHDANSGVTLEDLGTITDENNFSWVVNEPVGTSLVLDLRDNNGAVVHSGTFRVVNGTVADSSCVGPSSSGSSSSSTGASTSSTTAGATSRGTVSVTTSTSVSVTSPSPSSSSITAPSTITISASTAGATSSGTTSRASSSAGTVVSSAASSAISTSQSSTASRTFAEISAVGLFGVVAVTLFA